MIVTSYEVNYLTTNFFVFVNVRKLFVNVRKVSGHGRNVFVDVRRVLVDVLELFMNGRNVFVNVLKVSVSSRKFSREDYAEKAGKEARLYAEGILIDLRKAGLGLYGFTISWLLPQVINDSKTGRRVSP